MSDSWNPLSSVARYVRRYLHPAVPDPEGSRKRLKARFTSSLLDLAPGVILRVASLLEARDVLSLEMCSRRLRDTVSRDKDLWRGLLRNLSLPRGRASGPLDHPHPEPREAVIDLLAVENRWLKRREHFESLGRDKYKGKVGSRDGFSDRLVHFLDDRWIIFFPFGELPNIWDVKENPPKLYTLHGPAQEIFESTIWRVEIAVDPGQGDIIIALEFHNHNGFATRILRVHLADLRTNCLQHEDYSPIEWWEPGITAPDPSRNVVFMGREDIWIGDWAHSRLAQYWGPNQGFEIISKRLVGNYLLYFGPKNIHLFSAPPPPDANGQTHPTPEPAYLLWKGCTFAYASLSEAQPNPKSPDDSLVVYVLASTEDSSGLFYFRVTIYNPVPSRPIPEVGIDILGFYKARRHNEPMTICLGPEGKRGLYRAADHTIYAISFDQNPSGPVTVTGGGDLKELCKTAPRIEPVGITHNIKSSVEQYDFSEATGKIVLQTPDGEILLLR